MHLSQERTGFRFWIWRIKISEGDGWASISTTRQSVFLSVLPFSPHLSLENRSCPSTRPSPRARQTARSLAKWSVNFWSAQRTYSRYLSVFCNQSHTIHLSLDYLPLSSSSLFRYLPFVPYRTSQWGSKLSSTNTQKVTTVKLLLGYSWLWGFGGVQQTTIYRTKIPS